MNKELLDTFDLPKNLLRDIVPPGTIIGKLHPDIAERTGLSPDTPIIAPCIHDTGSAVAATPVSTDSEPWAYLSSGTWSLLGAELPEPMVNEESLKEDFTTKAVQKTPSVSSKTSLASGLCKNAVVYGNVKQENPSTTARSLPRPRLPLRSLR